VVSESKNQGLVIRFSHLTGGKVGTILMKPRGEGTGGALPQGSASYPSLKQESLGGSSG